MPKHDDLEFIIRSAWKWELKLGRKLNLNLFLGSVIEIHVREDSR